MQASAFYLEQSLQALLGWGNFVEEEIYSRNLFKKALQESSPRKLPRNPKRQ
jgi:hypothetical protein